MSSKRETIEALRSLIAAAGSTGSSMGLSVENPEEALRTGVGEPGKKASAVQTKADDAFKKIVALVNVSDRSEKTLRERLERAAFDAATIDEAVERARACGFIDDERFARVLIRSRLNQGRGLSGIMRELASHGIAAQDVSGWPFEFVDAPSELERALDFLERHPTRSKNPREGAFRKLVQKGYSSSVAAQAARMWSESRA